MLSPRISSTLKLFMTLMAAPLPTPLAELSPLPAALEKWQVFFFSLHNLDEIDGRCIGSNPHERIGNACSSDNSHQIERFHWILVYNSGEYELSKIIVNSSGQHIKTSCSKVVYFIWSNILA